MVFLFGSPFQNIFPNLLRRRIVIGFETDEPGGDEILETAVMKKCLVYGTFELEFVERNGIACARWSFKQENTFRPHLMLAKLYSAGLCRPLCISIPASLGKRQKVGVLSLLPIKNSPPNVSGTRLACWLTPSMTI
jgi:hypothetical protein